MQKKFKANITSETGDLETVLVHTPGPEVENMTPQHAERALYSDILNLSVVSEEYSQFHGILNLFSTTYEIRNLLNEILEIDQVRINLLRQICENENVPYLNEDVLLNLSPGELGRRLLEGVLLVKDNLTKFLSSERYALLPLHNSFFTRDPSVTFNDQVIISSLASLIREREAIIVQAIFDNHPKLKTETITPPEGTFSKGLTFEGGDLLIARDDILMIGCGSRTTSKGVDYLLETLKQKQNRTHVLVQQLPLQPESFIHLDMVFTFLDQDTCLIYAPVILNRHDFQTVHIVVDNGQVTSISEKFDLLYALRDLGMELTPILCGGSNDSWIQEREQWHSGANFLAVGPGKVVGYGRNQFTLEALNQANFEILEAKKVLDRRVNPKNYKRFAIAIEGTELSRGGGGCRCMTMPLRRKNLG